jgi:hypothetical protein
LGQNSDAALPRFLHGVAPELPIREQFDAPGAIVADFPGQFRRLRQKRPRLAPTATKPMPESAVKTRLTGVMNVGGVKMRFLVSALFGKSNSKASELDVFMRRLDRIAMERGKPVARRAAV